MQDAMSRIQNAEAGHAPRCGNGPPERQASGNIQTQVPAYGWNSGFRAEEEDQWSSGEASVTINDYRRGYNKGRSQCDRIYEANRVVTAALAERAERAERKAGVGKCQECRHWRREPDCYWGTCALSMREMGGFAWRGQPDQAIHTQENFGCIHFAEIKP